MDRGKRAPSADGYFVVFSKSTLVGLGGGDAVRHPGMPIPNQWSFRSYEGGEARRSYLPMRAIAPRRLPPSTASQCAPPIGMPGCVSSAGQRALLAMRAWHRSRCADGGRTSAMATGVWRQMEKAAIMAGADVAGSADLRVAGKVVLSVRPSDMAGVSSYANGDAVVQVDKDAL